MGGSFYAGYALGAAADQRTDDEFYEHASGKATNEQEKEHQVVVLVAVVLGDVEQGAAAENGCQAAAKDA